MKNFSVIQILRTFTPGEIKEFDKFVKIPYFGGSEFILNFWKQVKKAYPEFDEKVIGKERIFKKLYPGKAFNDATIRKLASALLKVCEEFLTITELRKSRIGDRLLLMAYRNRQLFNQYEIIRKDVQRYYKQESGFNFLNLVERHLLQIAQIQIKSDKKKGKEVFLERMKYYEYAIVYFLVILMQEETRIYQNTEVYGFDEKNIANDFFKTIRIEEFLEKVKTNYPEFEHLLMFNYEMMKAFKEPGKDEYFLKAEQIVFKNVKNIPPKVLYFYCSIMLNYCLRRRNENGIKYNTFITEIVNFLIKHNSAVEPAVNKMSSTFFTIAVNAYTSIQDMEKAESFIKRFSSALSGEVREKTVMLAKYYIAFFKGEYEKALEMLAVTDHLEYYDRINYRRDKLVMFYELGMMEEAYYLIHSMRQFLKGNEVISKIERENTKLFVNYYRRLLDAREKKNKKELEDLEFTLQKDEKIFPEKQWLISKIREL